MIKLVSCLLATASLAACSSSDNAKANASLVPVFNEACTGLTYADNAFQQASPALVAAGKLSQLDMDKEQTVFGSGHALCAIPPTDIAAATTALLGQAASIYLMFQAAK